uniref:Uncharacterized protein n=1 Tax=Aegilops tauschii subsp. strangulata TaxID=200361 RepID=A0A453D7R0_AEGTS
IFIHFLFDVCFRINQFVRLACDLFSLQQMWHATCCALLPFRSMLLWPLKLAN